MRNILLMIMMTVLPAFMARAEPANDQKPSRQSTAPTKLLSPKGASLTSCAAYGPGFVKLEGSDTCIKTGGAIGIETGISRRGH
jgi:hypothetical protein